MQVFNQILNVSLYWLFTLETDSIKRRNKFSKKKIYKFIQDISMDFHELQIDFHGFLTFENAFPRISKIVRNAFFTLKCNYNNFGN